MRRGFRNRWAYDNFPTVNPSTTNGAVTVSSTTGKWHNSSSQTTLERTKIADLKQALRDLNFVK